MTLIGIIEAFIGGSEPKSSRERLLVRIVALTCLVLIVGQSFNLISMSLMFEGWSPLHNISVAFLATTLVIACLLRWTRNATIFGVVFTCLFLTALTASAMTSDDGIYSSSGINTSLTPAFIAVMALIGLLGSRLAALICLLVSSVLIWYLYSLSMGPMNVPVLGDAPYHRAFQLQLSIVLTASITVPIGEIVYKTLDDLEEQRDRAERAEAERADYIATVSHEVRTPLNGVLSLSDLLLQTDLSKQQREIATLMHRSGVNMLEMINSVLDTAKAEEAGAAEFRPLNVNAILSEVRDLFAWSANSKGLWIGIDIRGDIAESLQGDPRYIRQILSNLTSNAIKFTQDGGIRIGVGAAKPDETTQAITFYVQDTGPGISKADQARIFDPFIQSETAKGAGKRGTGLGLSICKRLVRAMGGELRLRSSEGRGSIFHFTLDLPLDKTETNTETATVSLNEAA